MDARRASDLSSVCVLSKQATEQSRIAVTTLKAQLEASRKAADVARAQVAQVKINLGFTVVRAPLAGVVIEKAAQVGEIVWPLSAGSDFIRSGIGTILDMDLLEIDVDVNEVYICHVKVNMPIEVVLTAYPDWRIPGHVVAIVPTEDKGKAAVKVRIALEQKDPRITSSMGTRVSFLKAEFAVASEAVSPSGVLLPSSTVVQGGQHRVVYRVQ
ncbi:efflux RND transporter periplasmic adaptor subunit [Xylella fastidiosa subsp. multiplex]|nr:acriflavin resistance protein [Xylella fastidiosa M12]QPC01141.1 efflux RND transporter periplasmic adaptor subunit [Xylella fastidiosa subsp. multiplex]